MGYIQTFTYLILIYSNLFFLTYFRQYMKRKCPLVKRSPCLSFFLFFVFFFFFFACLSVGVWVYLSCPNFDFWFLIFDLRLPFQLLVFCCSFSPTFFFLTSCCFLPLPLLSSPLLPVSFSVGVYQPVCLKPNLDQSRLDLDGMDWLGLGTVVEDCGCKMPPLPPLSWWFQGGWSPVKLRSSLVSNSIYY